MAMLTIYVSIADKNSQSNMKITSSLSEKS